MSLQIGGLGRWGVVLGMTMFLVVGAGVISAQEPGRAILVAQKAAKKKPATKKGDASSKDEMDMQPGAAAKKGAGPADGALSFKNDIAPILVANCVGCHSGNGRGMTVGKLDMTTFEKLMAGGKRGKDVVGGDPDSSHIVLMTKGEETPRMPPRNGQMGFADEAAAKLETWVKQGAKLDAGIAATDLLSKYAASLDDLRRAELAKLTPDERDKIAEQAGRERWKKATKVEPELTTAKGSRFLLLSNLPKDRATRLIAAMDKQFDLAGKLFYNGRPPASLTGEKIGLYVFKDTPAFVEFVRTNENQEVESGEMARAKLGVESPYLVAVDPAAGGEEAVQVPAKKGARKKKVEESPGGPERTLAGVLTEPLFVAVANGAGKPPRWVSLGLGAFMASHLEPSSPYYRKLRAEAAANIKIGWQAKAVEALGGEGKAETTRAIGFALFEWMSQNASGATVPNFVHVMLEGQGKLDEAIGGCLNLSREEFLTASELWLSERYR